MKQQDTLKITDELSAIVFANPEYPQVEADSGIG
jgi:hypothetical protein